MNSLKDTGTIFCIYEHPEDYPDKYVARAWTLKGEPTDKILVADSLDELRAMKDEDRATIPRDAKDIPAIIECWI